MDEEKNLCELEITHKHDRRIKIEASKEDRERRRLQKAASKIAKTTTYFSCAVVVKPIERSDVRLCKGKYRIYYTREENKKK